MKHKVSILDCTLRDGGYVNDWRFGRGAIVDIFANLNRSGVEVIECGFMRDEIYNPERTVFSDVAQIAPLIAPKRKGARYFGMIALGDIPIEKISPRNADSLDGIRLTFHKQDWERAKVACQLLMAKGYDVCVQPVGTTAYTDDEVLNLVKACNELRPFALYIVDTLGILYSKDLVKIFNLVDRYLNKSIRIGFHSHNNLQLSFSNAQALIDLHTDRDIIVDTSVYGMGRGVGNLATELLAQYINHNIEPRYAIMPLMKIADAHLLNIHARTPWGYALPYFLSGTVQCHPNYASYLMSRGTLSVEDISKILSLLPDEKRDLFDKTYVEKLYNAYQTSAVDDSAALDLLRSAVEGGTVVLVAPGKSSHDHSVEIRRYADQNRAFVIGVNLPPDDICHDAVFVSNRKRIVNCCITKEQLLATSNLVAELPPHAWVFNYADYLGEGEENDNAGAMLIRILRRANVARIALAGFDGFDVNAASNYFTDKVGETMTTEEMLTKNAEIGRQLHSALQSMPFDLLTPTKYNLS